MQQQPHCCPQRCPPLQSLEATPTARIPLACCRPPRRARRPALTAMAESSKNRRDRPPPRACRSTPRASLIGEKIKVRPCAICATDYLFSHTKPPDFPFPFHHKHHGSNGQKVDAKRLPHKTRMALALQGPTLIFDGICNLCNGSMGWFQERVRKDDSPVWYSK